MRLKKVLFAVTSLAVLFTCVQMVSAQEDAERLYPIIVKGKYGFIDKTGKVVVPPQYQKAGEFREGLASLLTDTGYGYIDVSGRFVIKPAYGVAEDFSDGLAAVVGPGTQPGKRRRGYIDKTGKMVIDLGEGDDYYTHSFSEGLAVYYRDRQAGYIDKMGKIVIEPRFDMAFPFSEGLAQVRIGEKYGYIDKEGKMLIEPQFPQPSIADHIGRPHKTDHDNPFREGLASIETGGERGWSVIDKTGKIVFTPDPGNYSPFRFSEGLLRYRAKYREGFLNLDGSVAIQPAWRQVKNFSEGLAPVLSTEGCPDGLGNCWGFIDKTGAVVIKPYFASADGFKGGLAKVMTRRTDQKDGRMFFSNGYIDRTGKLVWSVLNEW